MELHMWIEGLLALCALQECTTISFWGPCTGKCFFLFSKDVYEQIGHSHFKHEKGKPDSLAFAAGSKDDFWCLCPGSYHLVLFPHNVKESLVQKLTMQGSLLLQTQAALAMAIYSVLRPGGTAKTAFIITSP